MKNMKKKGQIVLVLLACFCTQLLHSLPTEAEFLFEFGSFGSENGQFDAPRGIAVNKHKEIIVADAGNQRVQVFDRCGDFLFAFGEDGTGPGQFKSPFGVAITEDNRIVVTDDINNNVQVFDRFGRFLFSFGSGLLQGPGSSVAVNEWGEIIVNNNPLNKVLVFDRCGDHLFTIQLPIEVFLDGIDTNEDGFMYVNDCDSGEIRVLDRWGNSLFTFGDLLIAGGVAVSESGEVVVPGKAGGVFVFDRCGNFLFEFSDGFGDICDVSVSSDGDIYVADVTNNRIVVFRGQTPTGSI